MTSKYPPFNSPVAAVTFDVGGTLLKPHPSVGAVYAEILANHGFNADPQRLNARFAKAWQAAASVGDGRTDDLQEIAKWRRIVRQTLAFIDIDSKFDRIFSDLWETFAEPERWRLREHARETITFIRNQGIRTAILSNWDQRLHSLLAGFNMSRSFDALFISSEIGWEKPAPHIFQFVVSQLDLPPGQILHVGDCPKSDAAPALAAGFQALLIADDPESRQEWVGCIDSLDALKSLRPPA